MAISAKSILILGGIVIATPVLIYGAFHFASPLIHRADKAAQERSAKAPEVPAPEQTERVVVFAKAKDVGAEIDPDLDLAVTLMPVSKVPADALTSMDISSDAAARHRTEGWHLKLAASEGSPATLSAFDQTPPAEKKAQEPEKPKGNPDDIDFLAKLQADPTTVLFDDAQLSDLRKRPDSVVDVYIESDVPAMSGDWVARELVVSGATLRIAALDVTGSGAVPVFYAKLSAKEAEHVRAAQLLSNASVKVEPHGDAKAALPIGHICVANVCYEEVTPPKDPAASVEDANDAAKKSPKAEAKPAGKAGK